MASDNDTPPDNADKTDIEAEAKRVAAELLVIVEAIAGGLEMLGRLPEAKPLKGSIETLRGFAKRAIETIEGFAETLSH